MIDAHAVVAHLEELGHLGSSPSDQVSAARPAADWLQQALRQGSLQRRQDEAGNDWITLSGAVDRSVVLGSHRSKATGTSSLDSHLGLVVGLETLRSLAHRFDSRPPCTMQLVLWAEPASGTDRPATSLLTPRNTAAYLELHIEPGSQLASAGTPLAVANAASGASSNAFNPRLASLCDESIRELTGSSASFVAEPAGKLAEVASAGVPTAVMYVQAPASSSDATRLHLLQAAEAFGRWAESTMHLVAGDGVDLWAIEHRVPHS